MTVVAELAAIAAVALPRWRRDAVLAAASVVAMIACLWVWPAVTA